MFQKQTKSKEIGKKEKLKSTQQQPGQQKHTQEPQKN